MAIHLTFHVAPSRHSIIPDLNFTIESLLPCSHAGIISDLFKKLLHRLYFETLLQLRYSILFKDSLVPSGSTHMVFKCSSRAVWAAQHHAARHMWPVQTKFFARKLQIASKEPSTIVATSRRCLLWLFVSQTWCTSRLRHILDLFQNCQRMRRISQALKRLPVTPNSKLFSSTVIPPGGFLLFLHKMLAILPL